MHNIDEAKLRMERQLRPPTQPRLLLAPPQVEIAVSRVEHTHKFGFPKKCEKNVGKCWERRKHEIAKRERERERERETGHAQAGGNWLEKCKTLTEQSFT